MAKHRSYSIEFERQVAQEYLGGETLHGLATRPAPSTATWLSPIYKQTNEFPENLSRLAPWVRDVANLSARNVYAFRENQHCP